MYRRPEAIVLITFLVFGGLLLILADENNLLTFNVSAETWTETTTEDFEAGETAFLDIDSGSLQLSRGLNRIWAGIGEAAGDSFAYSVANAGDVNGDGFDDIIVSGHSNDAGGSNAGAAYIYFGSESGPSLLPDWKVTGESSSDVFGNSLSGAGDVNGDGYDDVIIGAYNNDGAGTNAGEAYVYFGGSNGPGLTPGWSDQGEAISDNYGRIVSGAGDVNGDGYDDILVGAWNNDGGGSNSGEAYLYFGSPTGPSTTPDWSDYGEAATDWFSRSLSGAGDVNGDGYDDILIGAEDNDGAATDAGEAYVYYGSSTGPSVNPDWSVQGEAASDQFGHGVSGAGDVNNDGFADIIVSAYTNDDGGSSAGKIYVFHGSENGLSTTPDWTMTGEMATEYFSNTVSDAGDVNNDGYDDIIAGAYGNDEAGSSAGKAYVYFGSSDGLSITHDWSMTGEKPSDLFGLSLSGAGDVNGDGQDDVIVSAYGNDDAGSTSGKAYVFAVPTSEFSLAWSDEGEAVDDTFGYAISSAGDVNGDGYEDIIVGAQYNNGAGADSGEAYVYFGSETGLSGTPDWSDLGEATLDYFGVSVSGAGDVNGDGYDDIIVGAYGNNGPGTDYGEAYVYHGSSTGPSATPSWSDVGEAGDDYFGTSVAGAGDVNGDGYDDVIIGAFGNNGGGSDYGEAYVYFGSSSGLAATPSWSDQGEATDDWFGTSVSGAGDVNGDGYDDVIVGAYGNGASDAGEAYVYFGSSSGPSSTPDWSDQGEAGGDAYGRVVSGAGDVNGDGFDDILVGAYYNDGTGSNMGEAYVYYGSGEGPSASPDWSDIGERNNDFYGLSVSGAGDVNDDGYHDVTIGASYHSGAGDSTGKTYLYFGSSSGLGTTPGWSQVGEAAFDLLGSSVSDAGDVNGDGYDDFMAGAYGNDEGGSFSGKTYVYSMAQYAQRGRFISDTYSIQDTDAIDWVSLEWKPGSQPDETSIWFQIALSDDGATWNFVGPDGTAGTNYTSPKSQPLPAGQDGNFIKVRIYFATELGSKTPTLEDFSINFIETGSPGLPEIEITSPNGGEDWMKDEYYPITWDASGDLGSTAVKLEYSTDAGSTWTTITSGTSNSGYYRWQVPNVDTGDALIRATLTDSHGNVVYDTSDATFAIDPPPGSGPMGFSAPGPGTVWNAQTHTITWSGGEGTLYFSNDGGDSWEELATNVASTYQWNIPSGWNYYNCVLKLESGADIYTSQGFRIDTTEPVVKHAPIKKAGTGIVVDFVAEIEDNFEIYGATLFYKTEGQMDFTSQPMVHIDGKWMTSVTFNEDGDVRYYIQSSDGANVVESETFTLSVGADTEEEKTENGSRSLLLIILILGILLILSAAMILLLLLTRSKVGDNGQVIQRSHSQGHQKSTRKSGIHKRSGRRPRAASPRRR